MNDRTLKEIVGYPTESQIGQSRKAARLWFERAAPLIRWDRVESPIGSLYLAITGVGLNRVGFSQPEESFFAQLDPLARIVRDPQAVKRLAAQLAEYLAGQRSAFDVTIDWGGVGSFQRRVLETARTIPFGRTLSYNEVARAIGSPKSSRAVGQALARNPVPIVVPCHRVLASDGTLHGYAGGIERKRMLLQLEGAI